MFMENVHNQEIYAQLPKVLHIKRNVSMNFIFLKPLEVFKQMYGQAEWHWLAESCVLYCKGAL